MRRATLNTFRRVQNLVNTLLYCACEANVGLVDWILRRFRPDVNHRFLDGSTILHVRSRLNMHGLEHISVKCRWKKLQAVAKLEIELERTTQVINLLLAANADVNLLDHRKCSCVCCHRVCAAVHFPSTWANSLCCLQSLTCRSCRGERQPHR